MLRAGLSTAHHARRGRQSTDQQAVICRRGSHKPPWCRPPFAGRDRCSTASHRIRARCAAMCWRSLAAPRNACRKSSTRFFCRSFACRISNETYTGLVGLFGSKNASWQALGSDDHRESTNVQALVKVGYFSIGRCSKELVTQRGPWPGLPGCWPRARGGRAAGSVGSCGADAPSGPASALSEGGADAPCRSDLRRNTCRANCTILARAARATPAFHA